MSDFFNKVKSTAGSAVAAVTDAAKDISSKGKDMSERSKLNKAIKTEETKINNLYQVIGQKVFETNSTAPAGLEAQFDGIKNAMAEIERLKGELDTMAAASSCPKCGVKISAGQSFCQGCGNKLN